MPAANMPLYIDQGASFSRTLTFRDEAGNPISILGRTFLGQIRRAVGAANVVARFGFQISDQTTHTGELVMSLSYSDTINIKAEAPNGPGERNVTVFLYDVVQTNGDSTKERILEGQVFFSPRITA